MAKRNDRDGGPRGAAEPRRGASLLLGLLLLLLLLHPATGQDDGGEWQQDLGTLQAPYNAATGVTTMVLSEDGNILVVGTDNGGVIFFNATTGAVIESAEATTHGAVAEIRLDQTGTIAALVYADGYVAAIALESQAPLFTRQPTGDAARPTAVLSPNGRYLVLADDDVELYHRAEGVGATFKLVDTHAEGSGPFVWFHRQFLFFGALAPDGQVTLYSYDSTSLTPRGARDITDTEEQIVALAVSGDGNRFAVGLDGGTVIRYTPSLNPNAPQLIPDYRGTIPPPLLGLALDHDGQRFAAWSTRELLWINGCNQNVDLCDGKTTEQDTVRLRPPGFGTSFGTVAVTPHLDRAVVQVEGEARERRLYNLPGLDHFVMGGDAGDEGHSVLSPTGSTVISADGTTLSARTVSPAELAPPVGPATGSPGPDPDGDDTRLLGLPTEVFLIAGIGALALLLLVVLGSVFLAMRRGSATQAPPLPSLASAEDESHFSLAAAPSGALGTRPGQIRVVAPSAPATAPPPEGLLVLQQVATPGPPPLAGLDLAVKRPEVLRLHGDAALLRAFAALLGGRSAFRGTLAVGGTSARDTPTLYERRVRVGLDPERSTDEDAAALFRRVAEAKGLPVGLVERRMQKDLGWMGERLHRPLGALRPLDRWKVRLALALVDRPHLVALHVGELPWNGHGTERVETLRRVLDGVARHYETLVVLLDDGSVVETAVRRVADEEIHLGTKGLAERRLLEDGRPVARPPRPKEGIRGRR